MHNRFRREQFRGDYILIPLNTIEPIESKRFERLQNIWGDLDFDAKKPPAPLF